MNKYEFCVEKEDCVVDSSCCKPKKLRLELVKNGFILMDESGTRIIDAQHVSEDGKLILWTDTYANGTNVTLDCYTITSGFAKPNYVEIRQ